MSLHLRYMLLGDVPEVAMIDRLSFDLSWSPRTYEFEITAPTNLRLLSLTRVTWSYWKQIPRWRFHSGGAGGIDRPGGGVIPYRSA